MHVGARADQEEDDEEEGLEVEEGGLSMRQRTKRGHLVS